jgi:hypothetical protein
MSRQSASVAGLSYPLDLTQHNTFRVTLAVAGEAGLVQARHRLDAASARCAVATGKDVSRLILTEPYDGAQIRLLSLPGTLRMWDKRL